MEIAQASEGVSTKKKMTKIEKNATTVTATSGGLTDRGEIGTIPRMPNALDATVEIVETAIEVEMGREGTGLVIESIGIEGVGQEVEVNGGMKGGSDTTGSLQARTI